MNFPISENACLNNARQLKADNLRLGLELEKFSLLKEENDKLKEMLQFRVQKNIEVEPLEIINVQPSRFRRIIFVNGGAKRGLKKNMFVLDGDRLLLGKILRTEDDYSEIILINDPQFSATVKINDNVGLLKGTLGGMLKVSYIDENQKINKDDAVWAVSYYSHVNFLVGKVKQVRKSSNSLFLDITVESACASHLAKTVFVIK
ncbi:MAG: rod shape-determining protein MreC [Candidatus Omnitrophota bacterium]